MLAMISYLWVLGGSSLLLGLCGARVVTTVLLLGLLLLGSTAKHGEDIVLDGVGGGSGGVGDGGGDLSGSLNGGLFI